MVSHNLKAHATNFSLLFDFLAIESDPKERKRLISILQDGNIGFSETVLGLREIVTIRENKDLKKKHLVINESIYRAEQNLLGIIRQNEVKIINEIPEAYKDNLLVKTQPIFGKKGYSIGHYAEITRADLLVMNAPSKVSFWDRLFPHDIEHILTELPTDVLIIQ